MDKDLTELVNKKREVDKNFVLFNEGKLKDSPLDLHTEKMQIMSALSTKITIQILKDYLDPLGLSYEEAVEVLDSAKHIIGSFAICQYRPEEEVSH